MNDFLCTQIVLKITITWWVVFERLSLDLQQKQRYDWRFSSKCFVSFRSWDTFLLSYWIDFLPAFGRTKNMNKVFRLKRFVNMAFRHCPLVLGLHQIHSKREHYQIQNIGWMSTQSVLQLEGCLNAVTNNSNNPLNLKLPCKHISLRGSQLYS